ncbi:MAG: AraC family ligand binding domain-containing protein [Mycolicibacterium sp.]|nr:AraC family ligand binding domain-containing protein [Mycolicibacterium sp.]
MSQTRHAADLARLRPFEEAPRPIVGYAYDYSTDHDTGWHQHPRAQLLHAMSGTMRVATATALFIVPPGTGLWVPAHTEHVGLAALSEGETPARVAAKVGYSSGPAFGAAFRSAFGTTPGQSRRRAEGRAGRDHGRMG